MKECILPFPKKGDLRLVKNYRCITLTSIVAKIYNALLPNRIESKIDNILRNELLHGLAYMSMHTKQNIYALIKQATSPHKMVAL